MAKKPTNPNMRLNARQEAFCRGLAEGKSQQQAYIDAGYDARGNSIRTKAARLVTNGNVASRVAELRAEVAARSVKTVGSLVADLDVALAIARADRNPSAMVTAVMGQAKLLGMVVDKAQVEAIVRRPAPAPGIDAGVIMSEDDWQHRLLSRH